MRSLVVTGFHRSGTSFVAGLVHAAGLFLGDDLIGAMESNPYGHFEDREIVGFHDQLLADNGLSWQVGRPFIPVVRRQRWEQAADLVRERSTRHRQWGFKDPRACLFLNLWKQVVPELKVLAVYRHFSSAAYSLERRHSNDLFAGRGTRRVHRRFWSEPDLALRMWLVHNRAVLAFARDYPEDIKIVSFPQAHRGFDVPGWLRDSWGFELDTVPISDTFDPAATSDRPTPQPISDRRLEAPVRDVWSALQRHSNAEEVVWSAP